MNAPDARRCAACGHILNGGLRISDQQVDLSVDVCSWACIAILTQRWVGAQAGDERAVIVVGGTKSDVRHIFRRVEEDGFDCVAEEPLYWPDRLRAA